MIELKVVVCLVARTFELKAVYEELDAKSNSSRGNATKGRKLKNVDGERAYQIGKGEPSDYLPCRVSRMKENRVADVP